ncbi:MAG: Hint domain-containing protein [Verrucomicrobiota bacterium]
MTKLSLIPALALPLLAAGLSSCNLIGGLVKVALPFAGLKVAYACIPEHTLVDTPSGPRPVEQLESGEMVTGYTGRPVRILQKHSYMENPQTVFLKITFTDGASVDLCGKHRIAGIQAQNLRVGQAVAGGIVASITARTGETKSYDLLTEDAGYQIHGVPVNSMIEEMHAAAAGMKAVRKE